MIKNSIFIIPGYGSVYEIGKPSIERLDFDGDRLINKRVIGNSDEKLIPVLLEAPVNYCV